MYTHLRVDLVALMVKTIFIEVHQPCDNVRFLFIFRLKIKTAWNGQFSPTALPDLTSPQLNEQSKQLRNQANPSSFANILKTYAV